MSKVMVSVICTAYNHERYIRQCLDGFMMQQTNFDVEFIINDDCSTDKTADIIKEYEVKDSRIKAIYQNKNQFSQGICLYKSVLFPMVKGEYIALCEGDDYWNDPLKLQKQYEVMKNNPRLSCCTHSVQSIGEKGEKLDIYFPNKRDRKFLKKLNDYSIVLNKYPFHTSSYFFRNDIIKLMFYEKPDFLFKFQLIDFALLQYLYLHGSFYFIDEAMSFYRIVSIDSWSMQNRNNNRKAIEQMEQIISRCKLYNDFTENKYKQIVDRKIYEHMASIIICRYGKKALFEKKNKIFRINYFKQRNGLNYKVHFFCKSFFPKSIAIYSRVLKFIRGSD